MRTRALLSLLIVLGLALGVYLGQYVLFDPGAPIDDNHWTGQVGEFILIRPLMLLVIPLILISVAVGVASMGSPVKMGLIGGASLLYIAVSTLLAAALGVAVASAYHPAALPGKIQDELRRSAARQLEAAGEIAPHITAIQQNNQSHVGVAWQNMLRQALPVNLLVEMTNTRPLGVIVFALLLGLGLAAGRDRTAPALRVLEALHDALINLARWLAWLAPIGVMFLTAFTVARIGFKELAGPLSRYITVVVGALALHGLIVLPVLMLIFARCKPLAYIWRVRLALLTALGTSSSLATLPVSMETCVRSGGCSKRAAQWVLPLGAAINRNGTALFHGVAAVFLFPLFGIPLGFGELVIVVITATMAAVAAPGFPSAGLVTLVVVVTAVNTSLEGRGIERLPIEAIGVIVGIDRLLDMCRTAVNVWSDLVAAKIITEITADTPEPQTAV
jgi:Na+/H+-dicarboxylate symporter